MLFMRFLTCLLLTFSLVVTATVLSGQDGMNIELMGAILKKESEKIEGEEGSWILYIGERLLLVLTDESNNRMRIFTPIAEQGGLSREEMEKMLEANFHSALDAKYGLYNGFVVSLFPHQLRELTEFQLVDAIPWCFVWRLLETTSRPFSTKTLMVSGFS